MRPDTALPDSRFTTRAQAEFRGGGRRRILGAIVVALLGLVALVVFGPDESRIKERFEYYGAPGEMRIMDEISIEDGRDRAAQLPRSLQAPPPPARVEVEPEDLVPEAAETVPEPREAEPTEIAHDYAEPVIDSDVSSEYRVEMALPMQTSEYYYLIHAPRPEYPLNAPEPERRTPTITVVASVWVDRNGDVTDVLIQRSDGSAAFSAAVVETVREWKFGWLKDPGPHGINVIMTFNFRSPYFTPGR